MINDPKLREKYKNHQQLSLKFMKYWDDPYNKDIYKDVKEGDFLTYTYTHEPPYQNAIFHNGNLLIESVQ